MVPPYITDIVQAVRRGRMDNTYKMVWVRALIQSCSSKPNRHAIPLDELACHVFAYYWDLVFHFDLDGGHLHQSQNPSRPPEIVQYVRQCMNQFMAANGNNRAPKLFSRIQPPVAFSPSKVAQTLVKDVIKRFPNLPGRTLNIYEFDEKITPRVVNVIDPQLIADYADLLIDSVYFRWTLEVERFNPGVPNIARKIRLVEKQDIRRSSLAKFRPMLDLENPGQVCFHCGQPVVGIKAHIDHVIPWSFLYSDDLWNLVYAHGNCNIAKLNTMPIEDDIKRLAERNARLAACAGLNPKAQAELDHVAKHHLLENLWRTCRGY
jgi:hypothetical protein